MRAGPIGTPSGRVNQIRMPRNCLLEFVLRMLIAVALPGVHVAGASNDQPSGLLIVDVSMPAFIEAGSMVQTGDPLKKAIAAGDAMAQRATTHDRNGIRGIS